MLAESLLNAEKLKTWKVKQISNCASTQLFFSHFTILSTIQETVDQEHAGNVQLEGIGPSSVMTSL